MTVQDIKYRIEAYDKGVLTASPAEDEFSEAESVWFIKI